MYVPLTEGGCHVTDGLTQLKKIGSVRFLLFFVNIFYSSGSSFPLLTYFHFAWKFPPHEVFSSRHE